MNNFSAKTVALTALIAWGSLMSSSAHAAILRSSDGAPVLTKDGNCVTSGWQGGESCAAAKAAAGIGADRTWACDHDYDTEKTVYFDFNKSALTPHARHRLDHLARMLHMRSKHHHGQTVTVVGFADRLGNAGYNEKLALKRAQSVRAYLVAKGVKARKVQVHSVGKTEPSAECAADMPRAKLIHCLRQDRRVEIEIGAPK